MESKVLLLLILLSAFYGAEAGRVISYLISLESQVTETGINKTDPVYQEAEKVAREYYQTNYGKRLGLTTNVKQQIVSGTLYSIFFKSLRK